MQLENLIKRNILPGLEDYFFSNEIKLPVCLANPKTSLAMQFQATCYTAKIPGTQGSVYNLAWSIACFKKLQTDCLVIDASVLVGLEQFLQNNQIRISVTHIVIIGAEPNQLSKESFDYKHLHTLASQHV